MRIDYDDEERALLAARLGHDAGVSNSDLAASFAAWFGNKPRPATAPRLSPGDLEDLRAVADWGDFDEAEPSGYHNNPTGWIGAD